MAGPLALVRTEFIIVGPPNQAQLAGRGARRHRSVRAHHRADASTARLRRRRPGRHRALVPPAWSAVSSSDGEDVDACALACRRRRSVWRLRRRGRRRRRRPRGRLAAAARLRRSRRAHRLRASAWTQERLLCLYRAGTRAWPASRGARAADASRRRAGRSIRGPRSCWATRRRHRTSAARWRSTRSPRAASPDRETPRARCSPDTTCATSIIGVASPAAAAQQVARALAAAEASQQPLTIARAAVLEASHTIDTGGDLGARVSHAAARAALRLSGRSDRPAAHDPAEPRQRQLLPRPPRRGDRRARAAPRAAAGGRIDDRCRDRGVQPAQRPAHAERGASPAGRARSGSREQATEVLAEVQRSSGQPLVAQTHRVLADLTRTTDPDAAAGHLHRCLELEKSLGYPELRAGCLWTLSLLEAGRDPLRAERASREAVDALAVNPDSPLLVYAWQARLRLVWQTLPDEAAMRPRCRRSMRSSDCAPGSRTTPAARRSSATGRATTTGWPGGSWRRRRRGCRRRSRSVSVCVRACCSSTSRARDFRRRQIVKSPIVRPRASACGNGSSTRSGSCSLPG